MSHPRYQISSPVPNEDIHFVVDTVTGFRGVGCKVSSQDYTYAEAGHLAQWLNERAKGYPSQIKLANDCPRHRPDLIRAELLQLRAQSSANWRERAERRYYACLQLGDVIECRCGNPSSHYGTMGARGAREVRDVSQSAKGNEHGI